MADRELLQEFVAESRDHLVTAEEDILALEQGVAEPETVNRLFRALHTVKGGASFLHLKEVSRLAHALENVVGRVRAGSLTIDHAVAGPLLAGVDRLKVALNDLEQVLPVDQEVAAVEALLTSKAAGARAAPPQPAPPSSPQAASPDAAPGDRPQQRHTRKPTIEEWAEKTTASISVDGSGGQSTVRLPVSLLDRLMNLATELVLVRNQNVQAVAERDIDVLAAVSQRLSVVTSDLQTSIMQTRMRPIGNVFGKFNRTVRDLALELGREVALDVAGVDVELDKGIIDAIGDPLTHLVRNAVAHGIEDPEERQAQGKPRRGKIQLSAFHRHGQVNVVVEDDGRGMDPGRIVETARARGLVSEERGGVISDRDAFNLIFLPGFTTAGEVTALAGRGVGMDVVKDTFSRFGAAIDIASTPGKGTRFTIKLPLTLAIVPALIVAVEKTCYALPQVNIDEVVWLHGANVYQALREVDGQEVYSLRGKLLPVMRLSRLLAIEPTFVDPQTSRARADRRAQRPDRRTGDTPTGEEQRSGPPERRTSLLNSIYIVVLSLGEVRFGLLVDDIVDTEEIVVKGLHEELKACRAFSGTTVLGDGRIAMILDVAALIELGNLRFDQVETAAATIRSSSEDQQTVLLFNLGGPEVFAVPLRLISRVEEIRWSDVQRATDREHMRYGDGVMPLVRIEHGLPAIEARYRDELAYVIVPRSSHPVGILAAEILDTVRVGAEIDTRSLAGPGVLGSSLIDGRLTLLVDLLQIVEAAAPGLLPAEEGEARRVLLAEDSAFYASLIVPHLRAAGYEVVHAQNGKEALARLESERFDLLISDIEMPVMNGLELAAAVRRRPELGRLPLLAISSLNDPLIEEQALRAGFDAFQSKLDQQRLLERVSAWGR